MGNQFGIKHSTLATKVFHKFFFIFWAGWRRKRMRRRKLRDGFDHCSWFPLRTKRTAPLYSNALFIHTFSIFQYIYPNIFQRALHTYLQPHMYVQCLLNVCSTKKDLPKILVRLIHLYQHTNNENEIKLLYCMIISSKTLSNPIYTLCALGP